MIIELLVRSSFAMASGEMDKLLTTLAAAALFAVAADRTLAVPALIASPCARMLFTASVPGPALVTVTGNGAACMFESVSVAPAWAMVTVVSLQSSTGALTAWLPVAAL